MFGKRLLVTATMFIMFAGCSQQANVMDVSQKKALEPLREPHPWVVRTDFSDDEQWLTVKDLISAPQKNGPDEFFAYVKFVSDENHRDKHPGSIVVSLPDDYRFRFCFVVDRETIENPDHPVLVVGFYPSDHKSFKRLARDTPASDIKTFRALPSKVQSIENNLSIANMGFEDFVEAVGKDGVLRGFP